MQSDVYHIVISIQCCNISFLDLQQSRSVNANFLTVWKYFPTRKVVI